MQQNDQVLSTDGSQEVGKITKQWSGLAQEYFTDADNFGIQCKKDSLVLQSPCILYTYTLHVVPMDLDVKAKATMLGACFLIVSIF